VENIFVYQGEQDTKSFLFFDAEFADKSLYELDEIDGYEQEADVKFKAKWYSLGETGNSDGKIGAGKFNRIAAR
jgi:hypothetical protein